MDFIDYSKKMDELNKAHEKSKKELSTKYALSNNPFKIGDIITDHIGSVKITKIKISLYPKPACVYEGVILNKNLSPNKLNKTRTVYQPNIIK